MMKLFNIPGYLSPLSLLLLVGVLGGFSPALAQKTGAFYVVNLESLLQDPPPTGELYAEEGQVYLTDFKSEGKVWHRIRLGFFSSRHQAEQVLKRVRSHYPAAWVARASKEEKDRVVAGQGQQKPPLSLSKKQRAQPIITPLSPPDGAGLD